MQHDLFRSDHDLDLMSFLNDILRSNYSVFDASRQKKHDAGKMNAVPIWSQSYYRQTFSAKTALLELLSGGLTVDCRSNLRRYYCYGKSVNLHTDGVADIRPTGGFFS